MLLWCSSCNHNASSCKANTSPTGGGRFLNFFRLEHVKILLAPSIEILWKQFGTLLEHKNSKKCSKKCIQKMCTSPISLELQKHVPWLSSADQKSFSVKGRPCSRMEPNSVNVQNSVSTAWGSRWFYCFMSMNLHVQVGPEFVTLGCAVVREKTTMLWLKILEVLKYIKRSKIYFWTKSMILQ